MATIQQHDSAKEQHLRRLFYLSHKSVGQNPELEEPTQEQKQWIQRKMRGEFI